MVNSRMHSLTCARIFYAKSSLVSTFSTHKKASENTREIQHESRRKAGGNLHLRSAVVDLRVQLVGETFTFFLLFMRRAYRYLCRSFSLSNSLFMMRWNSNREPLFILFNGSKLYPRYCLLYTLYVRSFARISTDTNLLFLSPSLSCDKRNKHVMCTKGSKR